MGYHMGDLQAADGNNADWWINGRRRAVPDSIGLHGQVSSGTAWLDALNRSGVMEKIDLLLKTCIEVETIGTRVSTCCNSELSMETS
jgi:hypothetical protein